MSAQPQQPSYLCSAGKGAGSWKLGAGSWKLEEQRHTAHAANTRRKYTATKNEPKIVQMGWARAIAVVLVVV